MNLIFLLDLNPDLASLFDSAFNKNFLRPITFDEATKYGIDELRRLQYDQFDFEMRSWTSEILNENKDQNNNNLTDSFNFQMPIYEQSIIQTTQTDNKLQQNDKYEFEIENELLQKKVSVGNFKNVTDEVLFIYLLYKNNFFKLGN